MERRGKEENSGWELCKENIQPLSSGRKMSVLTRNLDGSDNEQAFLQRQRELEGQIMNYEGSDPLDPWIHYINFLEQSSPSGGKNSAKTDAVISRCCQTFYPKPEYRNDKRFVEIYIKGMHNVPLERRGPLLQAFLEKGFGSKVSKMYISIAADYEALSNYQAASIILQKGIEADAKPIVRIKEALNNLQYRVAERLSKSMKSCEPESLRNFGSSVPVCGYTNEAQNLRVALSPGFPCRAQPTSTKTDKRNFPIFQGFNDATGDENTENEESENLSNLPHPLPAVEVIRSEQENYMKPRRWCDEVVFTAPTAATSNNQERIQIYEEEPEKQPSLNDVSRKVSKGVLSERKVIETPISEVNPPPLVEKIMYRKDQLQKSKREITFEHIRADEYLAKRGLNTVRALLCAEKQNEEETATRQKQQQNLHNTEAELEKENEARNKENETLKKENEILKKENEILKKENETLKKENEILKKENETREKEKQLLKMKLQEYEETVENLQDLQTKNSELVKQQNQKIIQQNNDLHELQKYCDEITKSAQLRVRELENSIDQEMEALDREKERNKELQKELNSERERFQLSLKEKEQMRQQFEEEKLKMQQCFDRERNESLLNFSARLGQSLARQEMEQGLLKIEGNHRAESQQQQKISQPTTAQKLPFSLYESNIDVIDPDDIQIGQPSSSKGYMSFNPKATNVGTSALPPFSQSTTTPVLQPKVPFNLHECSTDVIQGDEKSSARPFNFTGVGQSGSLFPASEPRSLAQKLPFSLYESNMEMLENDENAFAKPLPKPVSANLMSRISVDVTNDENRPPTTGSENEPPQAFQNFMPPPPTKGLVRNFEEDKENAGGFHIEKRKRAKSGVLQPSTTADPMELIYDEEEVDAGEEEVMMKRQEDTGVDFNVTDLTRALEFFPKPLVNSTPEKVFNDITCSFPPPPRNNPLRGARKSSLFRAFDIPPPPFLQEVPQQQQQLHDNKELSGGLIGTQTTQSTVPDQLSSDMQPIVYEDDVNFNNQKDNSYNGKLYGQSFAAQAENLLHNLSPIPETSKERWSCTSSSSSNNTTSTRGAVSSYNVTKSVPRPIGRFPGGH